MATVTGLACQLAGDLEAGHAGAATATTEQLALLLQHTPEVALPELDEVIFDLQEPLMRAAATGAEGERAVRRVLLSAADGCIAREVFTMVAAALSQHLRWAGSCIVECVWGDWKSGGASIE